MAEKERSTLFRKPTITPANIPDDPPKVRSTFYIQQDGNARKYYDDFKMKSLAITAAPLSIRTNRDDGQTVGAMIDLARARGWETIRLTGSNDFKRETWVQAQIKGVQTTGYTPQDTDKQEVSKRRAEMGISEPKPAETQKRTIKVGSKPPVNVFEKAQINGAKSRAAAKPPQPREAARATA